MPVMNWHIPSCHDRHWISFNDIATTEALVPLSDLIEKLERMQTRTNVINAVPQEMAMTDTQQDTSLSSQKTTHQKFPRPASLAPASSASAPSLPQNLHLNQHHHLSHRR